MSTSEAVVVIARWQVGAGSLGALLALVSELRQRSLEEPGCLGYEVTSRRAHHRRVRRGRRVEARLSVARRSPLEAASPPPSVPCADRGRG
jgi:hypothetical protein